MTNEFLWVEKYRPSKLEDIVLPANLYKTFDEMLSNGEIQNMLFTGTAGVGKTTAAKAIANILNLDYIIINGSEEGNIDTLRNKIKQFASTVSLSGGHKLVILDEADYLNPQSTQPALRGFMEEFSDNCRFIFTCNFKNRIIEPLHSRCSVIEFNIPNAEKAQMAQQFYKRVCHILNEEGVEYDNKAVASMVQSHFPDWRRCLNELQRYSATGSIDSGILKNQSLDNIEKLLKLMKDKNFTEVRKWVAVNNDIDSSALYRYLYDILPTKLKSTQSIADVIIILAEYQYKEAFVANPEINRVAALATIMAEADWK